MIYPRCRQFFFIIIILMLSNFNNLWSQPKREPYLFDEEKISDSFLIRWGFQDICNYSFDPNTLPCAWPTKPNGASFNPTFIEDGDIIFVRDIDRFFQEVHPHIRHPYIILTHGDYRDTCQEYHFRYLDDQKIIAWFGIHPFKFAHKKFYPLPLGIRQEREFYKEKDALNALFKNLRENTSKTKLLCSNFDAKKNPEREKVLEFFADKNWCTKREEILSFEHYLQDMATFKFVLSPRGWGPDTYRTWEALLVGTIPIVKKGEFGFLTSMKTDNTLNVISQLDSLYQEFPVLIVDDWEEITESYLNEKYREISSKKFSPNMLYCEYWHAKITALRDAYFSKNLFEVTIFRDFSLN